MKMLRMLTSLLPKGIYIYIVNSLFGVRRGSFKVTLPFFTPLKVFFHMVKKRVYI